MKVWEIEAKEKCCDHTIKTSYTGDVDEKFIIEFFGLNEPDIEWYKITEKFE